jgi:hypothetical protein
MMMVILIIIPRIDQRFFFIFTHFMSLVYSILIFMFGITDNLFIFSLWTRHFRIYPFFFIYDFVYQLYKIIYEEEKNPVINYKLYL